MTCDSDPGELIRLSQNGLNETEIAAAVGVVWGHYRATINQLRPEISYVVRLARVEYLAGVADSLTRNPRAYARTLDVLAVVQRGMLDSIRVAGKRGVALPFNRQRRRRR